MPMGQEFLMQQGVPQLIAWPISGNPIHHEGFSPSFKSHARIMEEQNKHQLWFLFC